MKIIFRTMFFAAVVLMSAACGSNANKTQEQPVVEVTEVVPSVSVTQVSVREVPQISTYTSTVQAYVKNTSYRRQADVSQASRWRSVTS